MDPVEATALLVAGVFLGDLCRRAWNFYDTVRTKAAEDDARKFATQALKQGKKDFLKQEWESQNRPDFKWTVIDSEKIQDHNDLRLAVTTDKGELLHLYLGDDLHKAGFMDYSQLAHHCMIEADMGLPVGRGWTPMNHEDLGIAVEIVLERKVIIDG